MEIAAVSLNVFRKTSLLFVCPGCGLARVEPRSAVERRLRAQIGALDRMLLIVSRGPRS